MAESWRSFDELPSEDLARAEIRSACEVIRTHGGPAMSAISASALPSGDPKALAAFLRVGNGYRRLRLDDVRAIVSYIDLLWTEYVVTEPPSDV